MHFLPISNILRNYVPVDSGTVQRRRWDSSRHRTRKQSMRPSRGWSPSNKQVQVLSLLQRRTSCTSVGVCKSVMCLHYCGGEPSSLNQINCPYYLFWLVSIFFCLWPISPCVLTPEPHLISSTSRANVDNSSRRMLSFGSTALADQQSELDAWETLSSGCMSFNMGNRLTRI